MINGRASPLSLKNRIYKKNNETRGQTLKINRQQNANKAQININNTNINAFNNKTLIY